MEKKPVSFSFEGTKVTIVVDSNLDGQPVVSLTIDVAEIADELFTAWKNRKA